jgi:protein phosphatase
MEWVEDDGSRVGQLTLSALEDEFADGNAASLEYCYYLILKKIRQINKYVYDLSNEKGCTMGTTLSLVVFKDDSVLIGNVGDTWVCRVRDHQFKILSKIHSIAGEQYENGLIGYEEYKKHDMKHVLTQAIGTNDEITPYLAIEKVKEGDTFIICSDGVYNFIDEAEICRMISEAKNNLKEACAKITKAAFENGSSDNMSIVIIRIV